MNSCFVATPLGFEFEAERELQEIWPDLLDASGRPHSAMLPELEKTKGGFELALDPFTAVQFNFFLKTANRVLLRLDHFRVRDFPKLHEKLRKIDLASWIGNAPVRYEVSAAKSRLGHEGRIREVAAKAWKNPESEEGIRVFIRIFDDECDVSLDSTGEHLHRRGLQVLRGEAPLRENIAAFCLRRMIGETSPGELREITLVDPMCGSGTFLAEAANLWTPNFQRNYSFQSFGRLPKLFRQPAFAANYRFQTESPFKNYLGFDLDPKMVEVSRKNLADLKLHPASAPKPEFRIERGDLLKEGGESAGSRDWVILNPPYGERLPGPGFDEIYQAVVRKWNPERFGMLIPAKGWLAVQGKIPTPPMQEIPVLNGGIDCRFVIWVRDRK